MLEDNIKKIRCGIEELGVDGKVTIVAATKTVSIDKIAKLAGLGIMVAGENRAQELLVKQSLLPQMDWHFIGNLQTNKVKQIIDKVSMIQSVDRLKLAQCIQLEASKIDKVMDILLEVNMGGELSKGGAMANELLGLADAVSRLPNIKVRGLMTVLPIGAPESMYNDTKLMYDRLASRLHGIRYLSMGMSDDYLTAIKYGANMIRLGSVLFGQRNY